MKQESDQQQSPLALPGNVKVLGVVSLLNDIASEMIFPLLPTFLLTLLGGNRFYLGVIEGAADSVASLLKLWSGGRSDQTGRRKRFILFGYTLATSRLALHRSSLACLGIVPGIRAVLWPNRTSRKNARGAACTG